MTAVLDTTAFDDKALVDAYVKAKQVEELAIAKAKAYREEIAQRGLLADKKDLYGNRYYLKMTCSFPKRFDATACEEDMGKGFLDKWKFSNPEKPEWRLTAKEIVVITSATAEQVAAL